MTEEVFGLLSEMLLVRLIAESALECEMAEVASQVIRTGKEGGREKCKLQT